MNWKLFHEFKAARAFCRRAVPPVRFYSAKPQPEVMRAKICQAVTKTDIKSCCVLVRLLNGGSYCGLKSSKIVFIFRVGRKSGKSFLERDEKDVATCVTCVIKCKRDILL